MSSLQILIVAVAASSLATGVLLHRVFRTEIDRSRCGNVVLIFGSMLFGCILCNAMVFVGWERELVCGSTDVCDYGSVLAAYVVATSSALVASIAAGIVALALSERAHAF